MRHRSVRAFLEQAGDSIVRPAKFLSIWLIAMLSLSLAATPSIANSDTILAARTVYSGAAVSAAALDPARGSGRGTLKAAQAEFGDSRLRATQQEMLLPRMQRPNLAALLAIRSLGYGSSTEKTSDEVLADAIALGPRPELERKNPYRKRKIYLFRIVRPVSIGNKDLIVRFRLRPKKKRLMAFDVRF